MSIRLFNKEIPTRVVVLSIVLKVALILSYLAYRADENMYIHVREHHIYDVKTPLGSLHKEIKSYKKFDPGNEKSEYYLNNPPEMK